MVATRAIPDAAAFGDSRPSALATGADAALNAGTCRGLVTLTRTYVSSLRTEQAATTRRRILEAAAACFTESGYSGTSLADIATRAGVSPATVKNNSPKRELIL